MKKLLIILLFAVLILPARAELNNRVIDTSLCGLSFIHRDVKIAMRTLETFNMPGNKMPVTMNITELPGNCANVVAAYVWSTVSFTSQTPSNPKYTVVNPSGDTIQFQAIQTGQCGSKCWDEQGTRGYRADVAPAITGNGQYRISINTGDMETDGITLLIIYQDKTADWEGHIIINDGLITRGDTIINSSQVMKNFSICETSDEAWAFLIASDLQINVKSPLKFTMNGDEAYYNRDFWNSEAVKTRVSSQQSTSKFGIDNCSGADCYSWLMMGLYYRSHYCSDCKPTTELAFLSTENIIEFGRVCTGEEEEAGIKITNMARNTTIRVKKIYLRNNSSDIEIIDPVKTVLPQESIIQKVKFKPGELKNYNDYLVIESDDMCGGSHEIPIKGTGTAKIEVSLPDTLVYIGKDIGIPIKARMICGKLTAGTGFYDGEIRFDATAFLPDEQLNAGLFDMGIKNSERIIDLVSTDMTVNGKDILLKILTGRVMLARKDTVPLKFYRFTWNNEFIENTTKDGCLRIDGLCQRNLSRVKALDPSLMILPNPASDKVEINLRGEKTGPVSITVLTVNGTVKETYKVNKSAYDFSMEIDLKDYAMGMYIVMINMGEICRADVMFVVK